MGHSEGLQRRGFLGAMSAATALTASDLAVAGVTDIPVENLTVEHFRPLIGESFRLIAGDDRYDVELTVAELRGTGFDRPASYRRAFSILFRGSMPVLPQDTYVLKHATLGRCSLFMVPIQVTDGIVTLEAIIA